jgi:hypothetical protein
MGQATSVFVYSPLEFVEYTNKASAASAPAKTLESFLIMKLQATKEHAKIIDSMAHKIRCVSEGWDVLPTIHLEILREKVRVVKVVDTV